MSGLNAREGAATPILKNNQIVIGLTQKIEHGSGFAQISGKYQLLMNVEMRQGDADFDQTN